MISAHVYIGEKQHRYFMAHAPRVGDTLRLSDEVFLRVTEVIWCLDESTSTEVSRVNIRTEPAPPPPIPVTAAMVMALAKEADVSLQAAKDALTAGNGDRARAIEWIRAHRWPR